MLISVMLPPSLHVPLEVPLHHLVSIRAFASRSTAGDVEAATEPAAITIVVTCMKIQRTNATTRMEMGTEGAMFVKSV